MNVDYQLIALAVIVGLIICRCVFSVDTKKIPPNLPALSEILGTDLCVVATTAEPGNEKQTEEFLQLILGLLASTQTRIIISNNPEEVVLSVGHAEELQERYGKCWCLLVRVIGAPISEHRYRNYLALTVSTPEDGDIGFATLPIVDDSTLVVAINAYKAVFRDAKLRLAEIRQYRSSEASVPNEAPIIS